MNQITPVLQYVPYCVQPLRIMQIIKTEYTAALFFITEHNCQTYLCCKNTACGYMYLVKRPSNLDNVFHPALLFQWRHNLKQLLLQLINLQLTTKSPQSHLLFTGRFTLNDRYRVNEADLNISLIFFYHQETRITSGRLYRRPGTSQTTTCDQSEQHLCVEISH